VTSLLGVYRERIFSPGKIQEDAGILEATLAELSRSGYETSAAEAGNLERSKRPACVLSMAQSDSALHILEGWQKKGTRVINSVSSVRNSYRKPLISLLAKGNFPVPLGQILPLEEVERRIPFGALTSYWLKRGDVHATRSEDVVRVTSKEELVRAIDYFHRHQIGEVLIQEHVGGEAVKFYGVGAGEYFRAFQSSSGDEITLQMEHLAVLACKSAEAVGLEIYGGDAIITEKGEVVLVDLNDWPSFSWCCQPAAKSIAQYVIRGLQRRF
jgi:glutathione synthase/RimK-type ligase-like ATP-grasp enzyme